MASEVKAYGFKIEKHHQKNDKKKYLKQLRILQKEYDTLTIFLQRKLSEVITADEYKTFSIIISSNATLFFEKKKLKEEIYAYYKKQHRRGIIIPLQKRIRKDKNTIEVYSPRTEYNTNYTQSSKKRQHNATRNSVTILSTPSCPYCKKAKRYLRAKGVAFKDYNINSSSEGKRLYRQYNGNGVPVVIINGTVIRGYSEQAMRSALQ